MNRYPVTARREGDWWVIDVEGVGVTQAKRIDKVEHMARDLVAAMSDVDYDDVRVDVRYELPLSAVEVLTEAKAASDAAKHLAQMAADSGRRAATVLRDQGLSLRDTAHLLGISFQRVHQLLGEPLPAEAASEDAWERVLDAAREIGRADARRATNHAQRKAGPGRAFVQSVEPAADRVAG